MKKLLALVVAGVAIKYFLDSEQGKELQGKFKDWVSDAQDAIKDTLKTGTDKLQDAPAKMN